VSGDRHAGLGRDHLAEAGTLSLMVTATQLLREDGRWRFLRREAPTDIG
jgi:hypothetical protein